MLRSEFYAAISAVALFNELSAYLSPKPNRDHPNFDICWLWTGGMNRGSKRNIKKRSGESWNFIDRTTADRPYYSMPPFDRIDPKRALFELYHPGKGIQPYRLRTKCGNPLCCNPKHQDYLVFTMHNDDTVRRYADYLTPDSPFFEHRMETFNPKRLQFSKETTISEDKDTCLVHTQPEPPSPSPTPISVKISIPELIKDGLGRVRGREDFYEQSLSQIPYTAQTHWFASVEKPVPIGVIQQWLNRWGYTVPDSSVHDTINAFGVGCVGDAFDTLEKPANLTSLLKIENFNFHPKLVLTWYSQLSSEDKTKIDMTK